MVRLLALCTVMMIGLVTIGCDSNPDSLQGTNTTPATTPTNPSNPGANPGLSGAAPQPDPNLQRTDDVSDDTITDVDADTAE